MCAPPVEQRANVIFTLARVTALNQMCSTSAKHGMSPIDSLSHRNGTSPVVPPLWLHKGDCDCRRRHGVVVASQQIRSRANIGLPTLASELMQHQFVTIMRQPTYIGDPVIRQMRHMLYQVVSRGLRSRRHRRTVAATPPPRLSLEAWYSYCSPNVCRYPVYEC